jgi:hypothetical protein
MLKAACFPYGEYNRVPTTAIRVSFLTTRPQAYRIFGGWGIDFSSGGKSGSELLIVIIGGSIN